MEGNPLECNVCKKDVTSPILLKCLHTLCASCITNECPACPTTSEESVIDCEIDRKIDDLADFLLKSSHEETEKCANCELISQPMLYCETCQQALCQECRSTTHTAKMFEKHKVLRAEERSIVYSNISCHLHGEPLILYNGSQKCLACIHCFNNALVDERLMFVPIELAYKSSIDAIENCAASLKKYQDSQTEELEIRQRILQESGKSYDNERNELFDVCQKIIDSVKETRDNLITKLDLDRAASELSCRTQIDLINSNMGPIRLCLMAARILCSSASKLDVLRLLSSLLHRAELICSKQVEKLPALKNAQCLEFRTELAKTLEPHIGLSAAWCPISAVREGSKDETGSSHSYKALSGNHSIAKPQVLHKFQALIDLSGAFGQLFSRVEGPLKEIAMELSALSIRVQEMQRDITMRRCLVKPETTNALAKECQNLEAKLGLHASLMEELQPEMQEIWQEQLDRVRRQQITYREKVNECSTLRCIVRDVLNASRQLRPYASCIEQMSALIDPRRCHPPDPAPMESICLQISTIEPDSEGRIAAIEKEEQNRKAVLEAKKKAEEAGREMVVKGLKHGKTKKKDHSRLMVNTSRERSPGGTDSALLSPFMRRSLNTVRDESGSELEEACADEFFDLWGNDSSSDTGFSFSDQPRCSSSLSLTIPPGPTSPVQKSYVPVTDPKVTGLLTVIEKDTSRMTMIQSLHVAFASQKSEDDLTDRSVSASAVKSSQKKIKDDALTTKESDFKELPSPPIGTKPLSINCTTQNGPKVVKRSRRTKKNVEESPEAIVAEPTSGANSEQAPCSESANQPPVVPFIPSSVFEIDDSGKLNGFEAKEKMLQSLKERVRSRANSDLEKGIDT